MKILIFRTHGDVVKPSTYNLQEVGIAKALISKGIQCDIMYFAGNISARVDEIKHENSMIHIYWVKGLSIAGNGIYFNLKRILDKYDIIQVDEYDQLYSRYLAYFSRYKNKVCMTHGPYYNETNKKYNTKIKVFDKLWIPKKAKKKIWCFAKSKYAKNFLAERGFENIIVTGVGLDIEKFSSYEGILPNEIISEIVQFKEEYKLFTYIGQISDRRNVLFLINVIKKSIELDSNLRFVIIGNGQSDYKDQCLKLVEQLGLKKYIYYKEQLTQDQVPHLYKLSDAFLLPTKYEIFGMVMLEAMYFNVPFLTTDNGGSNTVITNNIDGFILPLNVDLWADKIIDIAQHPLDMKKIGEAAHTTISEKYTWDSVVDRMIPAYEKIYKKHGC